MIYFFIGQIMEVKPTEREDKTTRKITYNTEVTVLADGYDEEGFRKMSLENAQIAEHHYDVLKDQIGKFVAIPYIKLSTKNGLYVFPDDSLAPIVMDKNPCVSSDQLK
ncbi:MAG: hypothetical protein GQ570_02285 [Helicobacteraceae bacterium]|nr:hypothetical protein [Helicobacteraceae bacterium]